LKIDFFKQLFVRIVDGLLVFIVTIRNFIRNTQLYWGGKPDKDNELIGETSRLGDRIVPPYLKGYFVMIYVRLMYNETENNN
jgi:hypothetical protein